MCTHFYARNISDLIFDDDDDSVLEREPEIVNIHACLLSLAASKLDYEKDVPSGLVTKDQFEQFKHRITADYVRWLTTLKKVAYEDKIPLPVEVMDLVSQSAGELSVQAEAADMGYRNAQIHPDIYMNELLCGMRIIHQVLPAIMKKLGMTEADFKLDDSKLSLPVNAQGFIDRPKERENEEAEDEGETPPERGSSPIQ